MGGWRSIGVVVGTVLAAMGVPAQAAQPAEVPCPVAELESPPQRPRPPEPPPYGPGDREVGGAALATSGLVAPPDAPRLPRNLSATSWLVADLDTGAVLGGCGPHVYGIPASTQKLLLALTLLPELDPEQRVTVTRDDLNFEPGSSAVGLVAGGRYPVETLWLGLLLSSGNDAANVLARIGGGDAGVEGTLTAMNRLARELGAYQTHAATPSGLDGPGQFTSAYDLALIARQLFDRADFRRYATTERANIPAQRRQDAPGFQIQNDNGLLLNYPGALGGKTGFTDVARHSFVGAAERDGRRLVVTLLGAEAQPAPTWRQAAGLLDWGFELPPEAAVGRLVEPGELAEVATSSTQAPTSPAPSPDDPATAARASAPVSAATVAVVVLGIAVVAAMMALVAARPRRRSTAAPPRGPRA
jgi:D-alanyl-D-alanine carboxypeptidase (penicillin-binding protein 5/6)